MWKHQIIAKKIFPEMREEKDGSVSICQIRRCTNPSCPASWVVFLPRDAAEGETGKLGRIATLAQGPSAARTSSLATASKNHLYVSGGCATPAARSPKWARAISKGMIRYKKDLLEQHVMASPEHPVKVVLGVATVLKSSGVDVRLADSGKKLNAVMQHPPRWCIQEDNQFLFTSFPLDPCIAVQPSHR